MKKFKIFETIKNNGLVAVVRGNSADDAYEISKACIKGGIKAIEVTFSTPNAQDVIKKLDLEYKDCEDVLIGAGTVLDDITARVSIMQGAKFIVSPHFDEKIATVCNRYCTPYLAGCASVREVMSALDSGCDLIKLFPGGMLGTGFIKDIKGPIPYVNVMPSGGVNIDNMKDWFEAGSYAVSIGSALTKDVKTKGYSSVVDEAKKFSDKLKEIRL